MLSLSLSAHDPKPDATGSLRLDPKLLDDRASPKRDGLIPLDDALDTFGPEILPLGRNYTLFAVV